MTVISFTMSFELNSVEPLLDDLIRPRDVGGIVRPICLAVLRLITSSNFVGCSTGSSAGLAPFRILSTYVATRR